MRVKLRLFVLLLIPYLFAATSTASDAPQVVEAQAAQAVERSTLYVLAGGTYNPNAGGLFAGYEHRTTYPGDPSKLLLRDQYVQYGAEILLSGLIRPAVHLEVLPLRILKLRLQYELWIWPGFHLGAGHGLVFPSADAPFDPDELRRRKGEEIPGLGHRLALLPTLQLKVWRVVLLDTFELAAWFVHGSESYWREPSYDNLIRRGAPDGTWRNFGLLLFEVWSGGGDRRVLAGAVDEVVHTISADITRHRVGFALIAAPFETLFGLDRPTLFFLLGINARDQNREDQAWMQAGIRLDLDLPLDKI